MYRNVVYRVGPSTQWKGEIVLYTWDEDGNPVEKIYPHRSKLYVQAPDGKYKSMHDTNLEVKYFDSVISRARWIKNNPGIKIYESFPPEREFLMEMFEGQQEEEEFTKHPLRVHTIDIEVAVEDEFPKQDEVKYPINVICVHDNILDEYHMWVLRNKKWCSMDMEFEDYDNVVHHVFNDEHKMLLDFVRWFSRNRPDVLTGWNCEDFDIPYLVNRIELFLGETVHNLSPVQEIKKELREQRGFDSRKLFSYKIVGISIIDYMLIYKHKFKLVGAPPRFNLDTVAEHELGVGKLHYEGTFKQFYRSDFKKFVKYNHIDVLRVVQIDGVCKYLELMRKICNFGLVEYQAIFRSSPYILGALTLQAHASGVKIMTHSGEEQMTTSFAGAYVFPVKAGAYHGGVGSVDLNSLYPSIMINLNISPETKLGKIIDRDEEEITMRMVNGDVRKLSLKDMEDLRGKATLSDNGILYVNPDQKKGIIPEFLERLYKLRRKTKDKGKKFERQKVKLKEAAEGITDKNKLAQIEATKKTLDGVIQDLDNTQHAFKIFLNSIYGQMGNAYFPLFDVDNATAVTLSGQKIIKESAKFMHKYMEQFGSTDDPIICGDTDSLYFNCEPIVKHLIGENPKWNKTNIRKICKFLDDNLVKDINANCDKITHEEFMSPIENIRFAREKFSTEALILAKKRYIFHARDDEGTYLEANDPKSWKCTGVDIKKKELPDKIKDALKHIIYTSLVDRWDSAKYTEELDKIWQTFSELSHDDIAFNKGYNTEKSTEGFLRASKGALAHARAVLYYNQLIEKMELLHKYDKIVVGSNMRFIFINKNNPYGIDVIAWPEDWPEEFTELFQADYKTMFSKVVLGPLKRIIEINKWPKRHPALEIISDIMSL